jgi:hypothetical protein
MLKPEQLETLLSMRACANGRTVADNVVIGFLVSTASTNLQECEYSSHMPTKLWERASLLGGISDMLESSTSITKLRMGLPLQFTIWQ